MSMDASQLEIYSSATELAAVYQANVARVIELESELRERMDSLNSSFTGEFSYSFTVCGADDKASILREMKRNAWRILIGKLGIERLMSSSRQEELRAALNKDYRSKNHYSPEADPIDTLPEISTDTIRDVLSGYIFSADEFLDELIEEEYLWLRPGCANDYATNEKNRWKITKRVIIEWGLDKRWSGKGCFNANYHKSHHLNSLDSVFHLLDGKGVANNTYHGELVTAIRNADVGGKAYETEYFRFKCYDNQNLHLEFKRLDLLAEMNFRCGNNYELPGKHKKTNSRQSPDTSKDLIVAPYGDFNFFETPEWLAKQVCEVAGIGSGMVALEPSAGGGRIAKAARSLGADVHCVEVQPHLVHGLKQSGFENTIHGNFLEIEPAAKFDVVVMNPPFCRLQDILHIRHAMGFVKAGGKLVAIASSGTKYRSDKRTVEFRALLDQLGGKVKEIPAGAFAESGTDVSTVMIEVAI